MNNSNTEEVIGRTSNQVLNDDSLILVFDEMNVRDLIRLQKASKQLNECILVWLKKSNCSSIVENEESLESFRDSICNKRQYQRVGEHFPNNLNFAVIKIRDHYLSRRIERFHSVLNKCTGITSLALFRCHINETVIKYFNEELKNLKCLAVNRCITSLSQLVYNRSDEKPVQKNCLSEYRQNLWTILFCWRQR